MWSLPLHRIAYSLEVQAGSSSSCRSKLTDPCLDGVDDRNLTWWQFMFLLCSRHTGLNQAGLHYCPSPLLVTAKAFESTSRTFLLARAADSAAIFCAELLTLPFNFTSPWLTSTLIC